MSKTDISFLLNPSELRDPTTPPMSPSTSIFHSLSPIRSSPEHGPASFTGRLPYIAPLEKRRCYGINNNKFALPTMSMAALCFECFSSSDDEQSDRSSAPFANNIARPRLICEVLETQELQVEWAKESTQGHLLLGCTTTAAPLQNHGGWWLVRIPWGLDNNNYV
ncbi:hypothetical protein PC123_g20317 [Phytophthora cactorum]|nr:hypothetical protein PC123_g20317 [Phytophthora cactorum]